MIIVLLANGFEEIEALTPVDMLRRAGLNVKTVGISGRAPTGAHGIAVICDALPEEVDLSQVKMAIFPGGMPGASNLDQSKFTDKVISAVTKNGGHLAAICAAPLVLGRRGLLKGKKATCYPGFEKELVGAKYIDCAYVTDGNITTAKAMGSATEFASELISIYLGKEKADEVCAAIYKDYKTIAVVNEEPAGRDFIAEIREFLAIEDENKNTATNSNPEEGQSIVSTFVYPDYSNYSAPSIDILTKDLEADIDATKADAEVVARKIESILAEFNVAVSVTGITVGPRITRYEVEPVRGTKVRSILNLIDDIALNLGSPSIRVEAPIPGKSAIGIEIPNNNSSIVRLRGLLETNQFKDSNSPTTVALGTDVFGNPIIDNVARMPHMLIGGATGMGKSVCINSIIASMLYKANPNELRLVLIDPKCVELTNYKDIPHLLMPILHDPKKSAAALKWLCEEMERRYDLFFKNNVRNLTAYNETVGKENALPNIVVIIDEFADLMLQIKDPVESLTMRIAQKSRAAGIHLIIGTQRPSVNVITGVIKANIPTRLAFKVASLVDSKTLIDMGGADKLLGRGDALYSPAGVTLPYRVQGAFISDSEVIAISNHIREANGNAVYDPQILSYIENEAKKMGQSSAKSVRLSEEEDEGDRSGYLYDRQFLDAVDIAINTGKVSTSLIQRKLSIGYGKAAKFIDIMEQIGLVTGMDGSKPRQVLMSPEEWKQKIERIKIEE